MLLLLKGWGDYRVIRLVEVIWKMIINIINAHLRASISIHDALHGFRQVRGIITATLEDKLVQKFVGICHEPLFQVFLDVKKSYNLLNRTRFVEVLWGYGLGANLQRLLNRYWNKQTVVPQDGGYYGRLFKT